MPIASVPPGANSTLFERLGRKRGELLRECHRRGVRVAARRKGQRVELRANGGHDVGMAVAHLMDAVAVEIHDAAAFDIGQPDAFAGRERIEAGRRQRLMQEDLGVGVEQRARFVVHVRAFERAAQRRQIDVSLGGEVDRRQWLVHRPRKPPSLTMAANRSSCW